MKRWGHLRQDKQGNESRPADWLDGSAQVAQARSHWWMNEEDERDVR